MNAHAFALTVTNSVAVHVVPGPEIMWEVLMKLTAKGSLFAIADAARAAGTTIGAMDDYVQRLRRADIVTYEGYTNDRVKLYVLRKRRHLPHVLTSKGEISRTHLALERIWRTMKMTKSFSLRELLHLSRLPEETLHEATAQAFLAALTDAGYLRLTVNQKTGEELYALLPGMATGPLPPRVCRAIMVYDPNRRVVMNASVIAEEVAP